MNDVTKDQKDRVMKTLAIFGFLAVIIFGVWLSAQIVHLVPQAFSSLASIADGVYNYREQTELVVSTEKSVINAGESLPVSWTPLTLFGEYAFSYTCAEGVSVDIRDDKDTVYRAVCDQTVLLGRDINSIEITLSSERQRYTNVAYTIHFIPSDESDAELRSENMVTVINASIPEADIVTLPEEEAQEDSDSEDEDRVDTEEEVATETEDQTETPRQQETATRVPLVSDPNGYTDLAVTLTAVGVLDDNGNFIKRARINEDERGAFQFTIENVGTKTSGDWGFSARLTSGTVYDAPVQMPLRPQEGIVFTLGYGNVGDSGIRMIGVTVIGGGDTNTANNSFTWAVSVAD